MIPNLDLVWVAILSGFMRTIVAHTNRNVVITYVHLMQSLFLIEHMCLSDILQGF